MDNYTGTVDIDGLVNLDSLSLWMSRHGLGEASITEAHFLTGGTQNHLLRFRYGTREFVLRRPPKHLRGNSNRTMLREARVLSALAGSQVPHPKFIAVCEDLSILGCCFYLMEPVNGFNATTELPTFHASDGAVRRRMGLSLIEGLAALGNVDYKAVGLADFGRPDGFLERQVHRWKAELHSYTQLEGWPGPSGLPGVQEISSWLEAHRPSRFTPGVMHGDFHIGNVMFSWNSPDLAAIIDWELCTIGDPLLDLGWLMATWYDPDEARTPTVQPWEGFPSIDEIISHYALHSERDLDSIFWYGVLACFKLGVLLEGTYARACAGKASKSSGNHLHANAIALFHRARRMMGNPENH